MSKVPCPFDPGVTVESVIVPAATLKCLLDARAALQRCITRHPGLTRSKDIVRAVDRLEAGIKVLIQANTKTEAST